jgi:hypothetical protein
MSIKMDVIQQHKHVYINVALSEYTCFYKETRDNNARYTTLFILDA